MRTATANPARLPDAAGVALLLAPARSGRSLAGIVVTPARAPADTLADPGLEAQRTAIPALRALPLLQKLALGNSGSVCLDYLPPMQLAAAVTPC